MFEFAVFFFFAAVAVIFALVVVLHRNPVIGALSLVVSFFALAVMYVLLDAPFLAALQVIVYAGAIMVLFLFVIMLLNLQHEAEPPTHPIQQFLGYTSAALFGISLIYYLVKYAWISRTPSTPFSSDARAIGIRLFEAYVFPFEMVSILLLAAIVGALFLSQRWTGRAELRAAKAAADSGQQSPSPRPSPSAGQPLPAVRSAAEAAAPHRNPAAQGVK